jgi:hypothetical protein
MNIWYHDEASRELDEAFEWYEVQKKDLGWRFISEAELTIKRIQNYPKSNAIITKNTVEPFSQHFPMAYFIK